MKTHAMATFAAVTILTMPATALAYVGPGAGLSLIGAFWALLLAVLTAIFFLVAWPVRRMLRRARGPSAHPSRYVQASKREEDGSDDSAQS
jgi:flagellar biogenesis protein FliO